jgi:hypothetical protein
VEALDDEAFEEVLVAGEPSLVFLSGFLSEGLSSVELELELAPSLSAFSDAFLDLPA